MNREIKDTVLPAIPGRRNMSGKKEMANGITCIRFLCGFALLFCPVCSLSFTVLYLLGGITDGLDGAVARRTGAVSAFGARLDTAADFVFAAVCLMKLLPLLELPVWLSVWIAVIALIRVSNIVSGYEVWKRFIALHTVMNKAAGCLLFILPLTLRVIDLRYSGGFVCAVATCAAVQEGIFIRMGRIDG